ncbi:MAG TPA: hypothetical protein VGZ93_12340 [Candidatus Methylacidiphilales bacterium]|jgi:uncharacterized membrane protein|nr:hypothetical protein [Candidatus Methylacidiphilales bacterium]
MKNMNLETKRRRLYPYIISPGVVTPAVLGVLHWQEDPAHSLGFLLARFFVVWLLAAAIGTAAGIFAVRFVVRK